MKNKLGLGKLPLRRTKAQELILSFKDSSHTHTHSLKLDQTRRNCAEDEGGRGIYRRIRMGKDCRSFLLYSETQKFVGTRLNVHVQSWHTRCMCDLLWIVLHGMARTFLCTTRMFICTVYMKIRWALLERSFELESPKIGPLATLYYINYKQDCSILI